MRRVAAFLNTHLPSVIAILLALAACVAASPITRQGSHKGRLFLAVVASLLVQLGFWAKKQATPARERAERWLTTGWIIAALFGAFNYYNFDRHEFTTIGDYADVSYYYLNSKYFPELGYSNIYEALLIADHEGPDRFDDVPIYRDLTTYRDLHPRKYALERADVIKANFTPERWEAFKHDANYIFSKEMKGSFSYYFIDHGYNAPPVWTLIGGNLARRVPVENLKWITSLDFLLVALTMLGIYRVCGREALLVSLVFFLCTFSGRWPVLGHALLRFDWLTALIFYVLCLRTGRHGLAGACLAYAALVRIFPAIFGLAYGAFMLRTWIVERRFPLEQKRFVIGALATVLLLGSAAYLYVGKQGVEESIGRIALHGGPEAFSSRRIGLGHLATYKGEWNRREFVANGGIDEKRAELWAAQPYLNMLGLLLVVLAGAYVWWQRQPPHRHTWLAMFTLFASTVPQANYYNMRLLPVLFHTEEMRDPRDRIGLMLLFLVEVATQGVQVLRGDYYAVTAAASMGMLLYFVVMAALLLRERPAAQPEPAQVNAALARG
jgi:hypothetical protein